MIPVFEPEVGEEEVAAVTAALRRGEISGSFGSSIPAFEQSFAKYVGCRHGIATSSGTTALQLAVRAAGIGPGTGYYTSTDNFVATIAFEDGSVGTLTYTALGSPDHPKERLDVYLDGQVFSLDDYRRLAVSGRSQPEVSTAASEKGQRQELESLVRAIREGGEWPIPLWQQLQATEIALRVQDLITGHA